MQLRERLEIASHPATREIDCIVSRLITSSVDDWIGILSMWRSVNSVPHYAELSADRDGHLAHDTRVRSMFNFFILVCKMFSQPN